MEELSFGRRQYRAILWTKDGHKRCCFRGAGGGGHHGAHHQQFLYHQSSSSAGDGHDHDGGVLGHHGGHSMGPKQVLAHLGAAEKAEWKAPKEVRETARDCD